MRRMREFSVALLIMTIGKLCFRGANVAALSELGRTVANWTKRFLGAKDGNAAMMFALTGIVVLSSAGGALDWSRGMVTKTRLGAALDAAALAVGTTNGLTTQQMQTMAQQYFDANYPPNTIGTPTPVNVTVSGQTISLSVAATVPTTLLKVVHIDTLNLSVTNQVVRAVTKLRVALVLDNTGSMSQTDATGTSKISALKTASHQLLSQLQAAAINAGDVQVALIPFALDVNVGTGNVNSNWVGWANWEAAPPNQNWLATGSTVGWGSACPYGTSTNVSPYGYRCRTSTTNGSGSNTNTIPNSGAACGYIIPGQDSGNYNSGRGSHYYNGYYDSVATRTQTCVSNDIGGPTTCTTTNGYAGACNQTTTSNSTTNNRICTGSSASGGNCLSGSNSCTPYANCSCTGSGASKHCDQTITTTTTVTGVQPFNHTWHFNNHNSWGGCVMDRDQNNDVDNTTPNAGTPATLFPAENNSSCPPATVSQMSFNWNNLNNAVDAMTPNGSTNQTIGFIWGWQALTQGVPMNAPASDPLTSQVIIILSDGLNTQNRWGGDGSNQSQQVDNREAIACNNAKAAGVIIYTLFLDLGGTSGNSAPLQNCASDASKYFDLTTSGQVISAFNQIGTELANLHLSL